MLAVLAARCRDIPPPPPRHVGIYFLLFKDEPVYVGQSTDIERRIANHQARRSRRGRWRIRWDRAVWMEIAEKDLSAYEGALIRCLLPKYNRVAPTGDMRDDEILSALGLPPVAPSVVGKYYVKDELKVLRSMKRQRDRARRWKRERAERVAAGLPADKTSAELGLESPLISKAG